MILDKQFETAKQRAKIKCLCDYCGDVFERLKHNVQRSHKIIQKDSCSKLRCIQKKRVESNLSKFGTENAFQNEQIKQKIKETNIERYGVPNAFQNKEIQKKQKETVQKRYGTSNVFQNETIKDKIKQHHLEKYGCENVFQNKEIQEKQRKTLKKKYGCEYALQNDVLRKKAIETCVANFGVFPAHNYGRTQKEVQDWLNSFGFDFKPNHQLIPGKEIDLYDHNANLAIEYCGLYWHNEFSPEPRDKEYHYNKHKACLDQGIQLLTIFSDEWIQRKDQCKSHIQSLLGVHKVKLHARKCSIREIDKTIGKEFFSAYHIQGSNNLGKVFFGMFDSEELVGAISLGRHNRQYNNLVLDRLCFKSGTQIMGGASRLFSKCIKWAAEMGHSQIISFSDNRWSIGRVYEALNFDLECEMKPDYSYVGKKKADARISKQSQRKKDTGCPKDITEYNWACMHGLARIWDCGKKRWTYTIT